MSPKFWNNSTETKVQNSWDVLNDNNAPPQAEWSFEYTDCKKKLKSEWKTNKDEQIHERRAENVYKNKSGPRGAAKSLNSPSSSFKIHLHRLITFDDKETINDRWKTDEFACMTELFEEMNMRNAKIRHPSPLLHIDETLYSYRGHIEFKQYNPHKPAKCGLLYQSLRDSSITSSYYSLPNSGKLEKVEGPAPKYGITGTDKNSKYVIKKLPVYCNPQGVNISMDRYFTSFSLAIWTL